MNRSMVFCVLVLSTAALAAQDEQWLAYRYDRHVVGEIDASSQSIELTTAKPAGVELPDLTGSSPLFGKWLTPMVPAGHLWLAFDRTTRHGPYDLLYIDSNADGSLKDETATKAYEKERYRAQFGPVAIVFPGEDGPITYHIILGFYHYEGSKPRTYVRSAGWYEGQIKVGQSIFQCTLVDYNTNGTFSDKSLDYWRSDRIAIRKKDGEGLDVSFVGNLISIDQTLYRLEVARDGAYIKLTEATDLEFGQFRIPAGIAEIVFGGENGRFVFNDGKETGRLPVGRYSIVEWAVEKKDDNGRRWRMTAFASGKKGRFDISKSDEPNLTVGWPIASSLDIEPSGRAYRLNHAFRGQLGERFSMSRDGREAPAPKVRITNADKSYDKSFNLEYG